MVQKAEQYPSNEIVSINLKAPKEGRKVLKIFSYKNGFTQVSALRKGFQLLKPKKEKKRS
ncbi:hypothetical protein GOB85_18785 [Acetobacter sp. LMG 1636]|uniref:Uncharacterized protein n=2 Tax=Acetobacter fallax TaxID=1737473 RepID=A0ABX0KH74_9PROT|nr:hypothetical protein [Acetobacter fallax]NHO38054.1 hypothetical protein [Acetobacter fallax]